MNVIFSEGQKYCANCGWCRLTVNINGEARRLNRDDWKCLNPKNISVDLVTGSVIKGIYHPDYLRGMFGKAPSGGCGIEGKWFKEGE